MTAGEKAAQAGRAALCLRGPRCSAGWPLKSPRTASAKLAVDFDVAFPADRVAVVAGGGACSRGDRRRSQEREILAKFPARRRASSRPVAIRDPAQCSSFGGIDGRERKKPDRVRAQHVGPKRAVWPSTGISALPRELGVGVREEQLNARGKGATRG